MSRSQGSEGKSGTNFIVPMSVLLSVAALLNYSVSVVPVLTAEVEVGLSKELIGFYPAFVSAGSILILLVGWPLIAFLGGIRVNQICMLLTAVGLCVTVLGGPVALFAGALLIGIGLGEATPAGSQVLVRTTPKHRRGLVFSIKQAGVPLGTMVVGVVVPWVVLNGDWRLAPLGTAVVCVLVVVILQVIRKPYESERVTDFRVGNPVDLVLAPLKLVFRNPSLLRVTLIAFTFVMMQYALLTFIVVFLTERIGLKYELAGTVLTAAAGCAVISRIVFGILADRVGTARMLGVLGYLMLLGSIFVGSITPDWPIWAIFGAAMFLGCNAMGWNGVVLAAIANRVPPEKAGPATAASQLFNYAGIMAGPSIFTLILVLTDDYMIAYTTIGILCATAGTLILFSRDSVTVEGQDAFLEFESKLSEILGEALGRDLITCARNPKGGQNVRLAAHRLHQLSAEQRIAVLRLVDSYRT